MAAKELLKDLFKRFFGVPFRDSRPFSIAQRAFLYHPRQQMLKTATDFISAHGIEGDYLEFGVYEGTTFQSAYHIADRAGLNKMHFIAFDSFEGLPRPESIDVDPGQPFEEGAYSCSEEEFKEKMKEGGVDASRVKIVKGWFDTSLTPEKRNEIKKAAIIWIDCDLYLSTVPVLEFITPLLQDGTVIVFDDWFCYRADPDKGEQRACREWLAKNPQIKLVEYHNFAWHGKSFIVSVKETASRSSSPHF